MKLADLPEAVLDVIYPRRCVYCASSMDRIERRSLCGTCWDKLPLIKSPFCPCCGIPFKSEYAHQWSPDHLCQDCRQSRRRFDSARYVGTYESPLRELVLAFKLKGNPTAGGDCTDLIKENVSSLMEGKKLDMVINVPLHQRRLLSREFDQAGLLAEAAAGALRLPFPSGSLTRVINTGSQTKVKDRKKNVRGAFMVKRPEMVAGKSVLLVDDVFTSGATMEECSRVLKRSGAAAVHLFTLARAI